MYGNNFKECLSKIGSVMNHYDDMRESSTDKIQGLKQKNKDLKNMLWQKDKDLEAAEEQIR